MAKYMQKIMYVLLGFVALGIAVSISGCGDVQPAVANLPEAKLKAVKEHVPDVVTVPAGTPLTVRMVEGISSGQNHVGDTVLLALDQSLVVNGRVVAIEGSEVLGRVTQVEDAGRVTGTASIAFTLVQLKRDGGTYPLETDNVVSQAQSTKGRDAATIGGAAGIGTAIGGVLGGKKGAIIGAGAGGAAGTGVVLATHGKEMEVPAGTRFSFLLSRPIAVQMP
jgi:hypothetical protein